MADAEVRALCEVARRQILARNLHGALATARRVLALDPGDALAHRYVAACLIDLGQLKEGEREARLTLALDPESPYPHYMFGVIHENRGSVKKARQAYLEALARAGDEPLFHRALARLDLHGKRAAEARAHLLRALALNPAAPETLAQLGELELHERRVAEAGRLAREALAFDPSYPKAHILLGKIALHYRSDPAAAREHALNALQASPSDREALYLIKGAKAHGSWWLGLWWRYRVLTLRHKKEFGWIVIGGYLVLNALIRVVDPAKHHDGAPAPPEPSWPQIVLGGIVLLWIASLIYFAISDHIFSRSLKKESRTVALSKKF